MKKCVIVSDSFKGTISSLEIVEMVKNSILNKFPNCEVIGIPIADGGEGTVEAFSYILEGTTITAEVSGPYFEKVQAKYFLSNNNVAIIEMAQCAGLTLIKDSSKLNPSLTTTYGVGELIYDSIKKGAKTIILGLGGSSTNDGGCGCLCGLKTRFLDVDDKEFIPTGKTLNKINKIDVNETNNLLKNVEIICMCDVKNPMYGVNGAAYVFAPQKGADIKMVKELDENLIYLNSKFKECVNKDVSNVEGAGAAGAFGAGAVALLNAKMQSGIELLLHYSSFDEKIEDADLIITGEGSFDSQSLRGKVIYGVKEHAKIKNVPVMVIAGSVDKECEKLINQDDAIKAIFTTNRKTMEFKDLIPYSKEFYKNTIENIVSLIKISEKFNK